MNPSLRNCFKIFLLLLEVIYLTSTIVANGGVINDSIIISTIQIINSSNHTGTGFLAGAITKDKKHVELFLVTNKHMLGCWTPADGQTVLDDWIDIRLYLDKPISSEVTTVVRISLKKSDGTIDTSKIALHPDPVVDVAVIKIDLGTKYRGLLRLTCLSREFLKPFGSTRDGATDIGSLVFAIGYPQGITSLLTNRPIVKAGYLAATPGEELSFSSQWKKCDGKTGSVTIRGKLFLVDGLIVPGNSGGPVVLPRGTKFGADEMGRSLEVVNAKSDIIGIVSNGWSNAGLTIVYSSDYINELIESFMKKLEQPKKL